MPTSESATRIRRASSPEKMRKSKYKKEAARGGQGMPRRQAAPHAGPPHPPPGALLGDAPFYSRDKLGSGKGVGDILGFTVRIFGWALGDILVVLLGVVATYHYVKWQISIRRPWRRALEERRLKEKAFDVSKANDRARVRTALLAGATPYDDISRAEKAELLNLLNVADDKYARGPPENALGAGSNDKGVEDGDQKGGDELGEDGRLWDAEFNRRWRLLREHWLATNDAAVPGTGKAQRVKMTLGEHERALTRCGLRLSVAIPSERSGDKYSVKEFVAGFIQGEGVSLLISADGYTPDAAQDLEHAQRVERMELLLRSRMLHVDARYKAMHAAGDGIDASKPRGASLRGAASGVDSEESDGSLPPTPMSHASAMRRVFDVLPGGLPGLTAGGPGGRARVSWDKEVKEKAKSE